MYILVPCLMIKYRVGCSGCPSIGHRQQSHRDFKEQNQCLREPWSGATERAGTARAMPSRAMGERPFKTMEVGPSGAQPMYSKAVRAGPPRQCVGKLDP